MSTENQNPETPNAEGSDELSLVDRQIAAMEEDNELDRGALELRIRELTQKIDELNGKVATEKGKGEQQNDVKIAQWNTRIARLTATRDRKVKKYDAMADKLDKKAERVEDKEKKIADLRAEIDGMEKKASELEASGDPAKIQEASQLRLDMSEKKQELKLLTRGDREENLKKRSEALRAAEAATREDEKAELERLGRELEDADKTPEDADKATEGEKSGAERDEEAEAAQKKELLHNALHKVSYGLVVDLEANYPGEEANAFDKMSWGSKAFLCKFLVMIGGTPQWTTLLNGKQKEFMEKKMGMQITEQKDKKGKNQPVIKFINPVEGWEPIPAQMDEIFTEVYGETGKQEIYKKVNAETTLADLVALAPASDTSETAEQTRRLAKALQDSGIKPDDDTKIQAYLGDGENADKVLGLLGEGTAALPPPTETTEPTEEPAAAPEAPPVEVPPTEAPPTA